MVKTCTKCKEQHPLSFFYKNKAQKSGLNPSCKACQLEQNKKWLSCPKNASRKRVYNNTYIKSYSKLNQVKRNANEAKRRSAKSKATPDWLTEEHLSQILDVYHHARECEMLSGDKYHVDHIVPLKGKNVCGLHVPWNLQVLPAGVNIKKGNRFA